MRDVLIHASVPNHYSFYEALKSDFGGFRGVEVIGFEGSGSSRFNAMRFLAHALRARSAKLHLVVEEYLSTKALFAFWIASLIFRRVSIEVAVHNINSWCMVGWPFTFRRALRAVAKRLLTKRAVGLIVVSDDVAQYGRDVLPGIAIRVVPFRLTANRHLCAPVDNLFCIPGNVDENRRDYFTVFDAFEQARSNGVDVQLELLGVYRPTEATERFRTRIAALKERYPGAVVSHETFVDADYFDDRVRASTALVCNVHPIQRNNDCVEVYGLSKETGIRVLADAFGKNCVVSRAVPMRNGSDRFSSYSSSAELAAEFRRIVEGRSK